MINNQIGQSNNPYWYPQLPEGYQGNDSNQLGGPIPMPGYGMPTGYNAVPQNFYGDMTGLLPGFGGPAFGFPGNQGFPRGPGFPGGSGNPGFPGGPGFPGFPQGPGGGSQFPSQQQGGNIAPQSPPPNFTPEYPSVQTFAVDPGAISRCMYRFTYVWLSRRQGFWFFPVFVGPRSVAGYRWNSRRNRWEYTGIDLNQINSFTCS